MLPLLSPAGLWSVPGILVHSVLQHPPPRSRHLAVHRIPDPEDLRCALLGTLLRCSEPAWAWDFCPFHENPAGVRGVSDFAICRPFLVGAPAWCLGTCLWWAGGMRRSKGRALGTVSGVLMPRWPRPSRTPCSLYSATECHTPCNVPPTHDSQDLGPSGEPGALVSLERLASAPHSSASRLPSSLRRDAPALLLQALTGATVGSGAGGRQSSRRALSLNCVTA